ncbi:MAG: hypothetical protein ACOCVZ_04340 [Gemmatimonadota bacterium]
MLKLRRLFIPLVALAVAAPLSAQAPGEDPIPEGLYRFVPEASDRIEDRLDDAVDHMSFLVRGIAKRRLKGANKPIDRIDLRYQGDSLWISLHEDEPWIVSLRSGEYMDYVREDGEVVQVKTDLEPGVIDQYFKSEDGEKQMIYTLRDDGRVAVETIIYSDKLEEPFRYTWVYERVEREP